jgi:hypothetical protein
MLAVFEEANGTLGKIDFYTLSAEDHKEAILEELRLRGVVFTMKTPWKKMRVSLKKAEGTPEGDRKFHFTPLTEAMKELRK